MIVKQKFELGDNVHIIIPWCYKIIDNFRESAFLGYLRCVFFFPSHAKILHSNFFRTLLDETNWHNSYNFLCTCIESSFFLLVTSFYEISSTFYICHGNVTWHTGSGAPLLLVLSNLLELFPMSGYIKKCSILYKNWIRTTTTDRKFGQKSYCDLCRRFMYMYIRYTMSVN